MPATIIMGGQWGDEGKGKITDALAGSASMVVRANGGSNAGHTVRTDQGTFKLHLMPSGILNPSCTCVIGAGVVIELGTLISELDDLESRGIDTSGLRISDRAHIVLPYHPALDRLEEQQREGDEIGTTLRGNGPAYADKVARHGLRMCDLTADSGLRQKLAVELDAKNRLFANVFDAPELSFDDVYRDLQTAADRLAPYLTATEVLVQDALDEGQNILVECAQGAMLDIDYGTYPYVTSSSPTAAGACQGAGIAPNRIDRIVGVYKAYSTRVGAGPMPTELKDRTGDRIRERGREFGTTTGRPRRIGWFDGVAARQSARLNGVTHLAVTLLDVLDEFPEIRMATGYETERGTLSHVPALLDRLEGAHAMYETMPGWTADITAVRAFDELPDAAKSYLARIVDVLRAPVAYVGVGPAREQLVEH